MGLHRLPGDAEPHRIYGCERFGPPLPGSGPILSLVQWDGGLVAVRQTNSFPPYAAYIWHHGDTEWDRIWIH
jgi:hypothetical protein